MNITSISYHQFCEVDKILGVTFDGVGEKTYSTKYCESGLIGRLIGIDWKLAPLSDQRHPYDFSFDSEENLTKFIIKSYEIYYKIFVISV